MRESGQRPLKSQLQRTSVLPCVNSIRGLGGKPRALKLAVGVTNSRHCFWGALLAVFHPTTWRDRFICVLLETQALWAHRVSQLAWMRIKRRGKLALGVSVAQRVGRGLRNRSVCDAGIWKQVANSEMPPKQVQVLVVLILLVTGGSLHSEP